MGSVVGGWLPENLSPIYRKHRAKRKPRTILHWQIRGWSVKKHRCKYCALYCEVREKKHLTLISYCMEKRGAVWPKRFVRIKSWRNAYYKCMCWNNYTFLVKMCWNIYIFCIKTYWKIYTFNVKCIERQIADRILIAGRWKNV